MKTINGIKLYFVKYAEYFGLSSENSFPILFPMMLGTLVMLLLILVALIGGDTKTTGDIGRIIVGIGFASMALFFGLSGFMMMIKREIPGRPALRGSIWAIIWGFIATLFFLFGGLFLSISILTQ